MTPFKKEFEYFLIMCQCPNLGLAAEQAGIGQAGMSKALKGLEEAAGGQLFYRTHRGTQITPLGEALRQSLARAARMWSASFESESKELTQAVGSFKVATHQTIALTLLSPFFGQLCEEYPAIKINLDFKRSAQALRDVVEFQAQLGIVVNPVQHPDLIIHTLSHESIDVYAKSKDENAKVLYYNPEMIDIVENLKKFRSYKHVAINDYEVIAEIASHSQGLAILPSPLARRHPNLKKLGRKLGEVKECLIYRHDIYRTQAFEVIVKKFKEMAKKPLQE